MTDVNYMVPITHDRSDQWVNSLRYIIQHRSLIQSVSLQRCHGYATFNNTTVRNLFLRNDFEVSQANQKSRLM